MEEGEIFGNTKSFVFLFVVVVVVVVSSNYRLPRVSLLRIYHNALEVIESNMAIVYSSLITSLQ